MLQSIYILSAWSVRIHEPQLALRHVHLHRFINGVINEHRFSYTGRNLIFLSLFGDAGQKPRAAHLEPFQHVLRNAVSVPIKKFILAELLIGQRYIRLWLDILLLVRKFLLLPDNRVGQYGPMPVPAII